MAKRDDWVYDELICFLGNPLFQIPVLTFMEAHCLIFDPTVQDCQEYRIIHAEYKRLVERLLDGFMADTKLSHDQCIRALTDMNSKDDLREIFQGLFEQVLSIDDYAIFSRLMIQKNLELQQQALLLIIQMTGCLPDSLVEGGIAIIGIAANPANNNEEEVMSNVIEKSRREFESQKRKGKKEEEDIQAILIISQAEVGRLEAERQREQRRLDEALQQLTLDEPKQQRSSQGRSSRQPTSVMARNDATVSSRPPQLSTSKSQVSGTEAAANWMKSAQDEVQPSGSRSDAVTAAAAALKNLTPSELKKRQEYLSEQRDKLLAMKKKEREKQLLKAERMQPQRPMSARAARSALSKSNETMKAPAQSSPEDERKLAMRRAIADRIKAEVMGKK